MARTAALIRNSQRKHTHTQIREKKPATTADTNGGTAAKKEEIVLGPPEFQVECEVCRPRCRTQPRCDDDA